MRTFLMVAACVLLLSGSASAEGPCQNSDNTLRQDGACWNSLSPLEKAASVRGFWAGMGIGILGRGLRGVETWALFGFDPVEVPEETTIGDIWSYFDKLYESPANRKIEWYWAYVLASLYARDDDENDRLTLLAYLREHGRLPINGTIKRVKDAETIVVEDDGLQFEIRLAGVSVPDEIASKTKALLTAVSLGEIMFLPNCNSPDPIPVSLAYWSEFFDADKRLVAFVKVPSYMMACVGSQPVNFHAEHTDYTNLNHFLVMNGLARSKPITDGLWTDARKQLPKSLAAAEAGAKGAGFYIHGENSSAIVEQLTPKNPGSSL